MKIRWSPEAVDDLGGLRACISADNPSAAARMARRIVEVVELLLPDHPRAGRPGRVPGTRELVIPHTPYIVPYRIVHGTVDVLRVYHSARKWPERF